MNSTVL